MADKQINELGSILPSGGVESDYLLPVYNVNSLSSERLKKATISEVLIPKWNPFTGTRQFPVVILRYAIICNLIYIGAPESAPLAKVSAADFIISVIHNDNPPYQYGIWKDGDESWLDPQADPRDAIILLDCDDYSAGTITCAISVRDASSNWTTVNAYVIVQDINNFCAPA